MTKTEAIAGLLEAMEAVAFYTHELTAAEPKVPAKTQKQTEKGQMTLPGDTTPTGYEEGR